VSSRTTIWIAAVSGTATSAPSTPRSAAPTTTLPTTKKPETSAVRPWIAGCSA